MDKKQSQYEIWKILMDRKKDEIARYKDEPVFGKTFCLLGDSLLTCMLCSCQPSSKADAS